MSIKLKKEDSQHVIDQFFTNAEVHTHSHPIVYKGDSKCMTPNESKCKRSPLSDAKPIKKLNLELEIEDADQPEDCTEEHIRKIMAINNGNTPENGVHGPEPINVDQLAFEDRLIAKFSDLMTEKLKLLENSIKELTECQKQHSDSIKEISNIQAENKWLRRQMEGITKENNTLQDRLMKIENKLLENSIVLSGVPEEPWELESNLRDKVIKILAHTVDAAEYEDQLEVVRGVRINKILRKGTYSSKIIWPVSITIEKYSDAAYVLENRYYLPQGVFAEREYTEETEKKRKILRPCLRAAKNLNHYAGRCRISSDKLIINSRKYSTNELDRLPQDLSGFEITTKQSREGMCFFGELNPLSNFHSAQFTVNGETYASSEQFIQKTKAEYFGENRVAEEIMQTSSALECKRLARENTRYDHAEWCRIAKPWSEPGIRSKFEQNPTLMNLLLNTGDGIIAEATYDKLWGTGVPLHHNNALKQQDWANIGILGEILMKIRDDNSERGIPSGNNHSATRTITSGGNRSQMDQT